MKSADGLLRLVVALLPPRRREWGRAMRAELASLDTASARWLFVAGCLRAALSQASVRSYAGPLVSALAVGGTVAATGTTNYLPLRVVLIAYVTLPVARSPGLEGSSHWLPPDLIAPAWRSPGVALVGLFAVRVVTGMGGGGDPWALTTTGVPIMAALSVCYLVAVLLMTTESDGANGGAAVGAGVGLAAGGMWTVVALAYPPVPAGISTAVVTMAVSALAAVTVVIRRGSPPVHVAAATSAVAACALVINIAVDLIAARASVRFIPLLADDGSIPQAARIAQSRTELNDPYIAVLFLGALAVLALIAVLAASRRTAARPAGAPTEAAAG